MALKYFAGFTVIILLIVIGGGLYLYLTADVSVSAFGVEAVQASTKTAEFETIKKSISEDTYTGTLFNGEELGNAEDYVFLTYKVKLNNKLFLPIESIEVQVTPGQNDIIQLANFENFSLEAKSTGDIYVTIISKARISQVREFVITYYVWGQPFTLRETYG